MEKVSRWNQLNLVLSQIYHQSRDQAMLIGCLWVTVWRHWGCLGLPKVGSNPVTMEFQREQSVWPTHNPFLRGRSGGRACGQKCQPPSFGLRKPPVWAACSLTLRRQSSMHHSWISVLGVSRLSSRIFWSQLILNKWSAPNSDHRGMIPSLSLGTVAVIKNRSQPRESMCCAGVTLTHKKDAWWTHLTSVLSTPALKRN